MEQKDILNFKKNIADKSLNDLKEMLNDLNTELNNMILNNGLIIKIAILEEEIRNKEAN